MTVGDSNSSGASGTSECTGVPSQFNIGSNKAPPRHVPPVNAEMETTLTRPFATSALRQAQLQRYRAKRLARHLGHKKIRYECRKTLADNRPRIKGRFAKVTPGEGHRDGAVVPNLTALGKKAKEEEQEGKPQSSNDSTGGATKGRRSRLSGGSDANSGAGVKGTAANGRRSSGEATAETEGVGTRTPSTGGPPRFAVHPERGVARAARPKMVNEALEQISRGRDSKLYHHHSSISNREGRPRGMANRARSRRCPRLLYQRGTGTGRGGNRNIRVRNKREECRNQKANKKRGRMDGERAWVFW